MTALMYEYNAGAVVNKAFVDNINPWLSTRKPRMKESLIRGSVDFVFYLYVFVYVFVFVLYLFLLYVVSICICFGMVFVYYVC